jgi:hypothetical protein
VKLKKKQTIEESFKKKYFEEENKKD